MKKVRKKYNTAGPVDPKSLGTGKLVEYVGKAKNWLKSKMSDRKINMNNSPAPKGPVSDIKTARKGGSKTSKKK